MSRIDIIIIENLRFMIGFGEDLYEALKLNTLSDIYYR